MKKFTFSLFTLFVVSLLISSCKNKSESKQTEKSNISAKKTIKKTEPIKINNNKKQSFRWNFKKNKSINYEFKHEINSHKRIKEEYKDHKMIMSGDLNLSSQGSYADLEIRNMKTDVKSLLPENVPQPPKDFKMPPIPVGSINQDSSFKDQDKKQGMDMFVGFMFVLPKTALKVSEEEILKISVPYRISDNKNELINADLKIKLVEYIRVKNKNLAKLELMLDVMDYKKIIDTSPKKEEWEFVAKAKGELYFNIDDDVFEKGDLRLKLSQTKHPSSQNKDKESLRTENIMSFKRK